MERTRKESGHAAPGGSRWPSLGGSIWVTLPGSVWATPGGSASPTPVAQYRAAADTPSLRRARAWRAIRRAPLASAGNGMAVAFAPYCDDAPAGPLITGPLWHARRRSLSHREVVRAVSRPAAVLSLAENKRQQPEDSQERRREKAYSI